MNDLSRGWISNSDEVQSAILRVLQSGWFVHGPEHAAFEAEFAAFLGARGAVGVGSGTDALMVAMASLGAGPNTVVAVAPNAGGYATAAALRLGCKVLMVDIDPTSGVIDTDGLEAVQDQQIDLLVVTHLYGNVADATLIRDWCDRRGVALIEDCAQALGAFHLGRRVGTIGHVGVFSFYPTKNLGGAGDGGAVVSDDPELLRKAEMLRQYGWDKRYAVRAPGGWNTRLDELQAAVLRIGLPRVDSLNEERRRIVGRYAQASEASSSIMILTRDSPACGAHLAVVRTSTPGTRERLALALSAAGIGSGVHYPILDHRQVAWRGTVVAGALPGARALDQCVLTIPAFNGMQAEEVEAVAAVLASAG